MNHWLLLIFSFRKICYLNTHFVYAEFVRYNLEVCTVAMFVSVVDLLIIFHKEFVRIFSIKLSSKFDVILNFLDISCSCFLFLFYSAFIK
jgi:hypothetical protein